MLQAGDEARENEDSIDESLLWVPLNLTPFLKSNPKTDCEQR